jgi:hypothetical protein
MTMEHRITPALSHALHDIEQNLAPCQDGFSDDFTHDDGVRLQNSLRAISSHLEDALAFERNLFQAMYNEEVGSDWARQSLSSSHRLNFDKKYLKRGIELLHSLVAYQEQAEAAFMDANFYDNGFEIGPVALEGYRNDFEPTTELMKQQEADFCRVKDTISLFYAKVAHLTEMLRGLSPDCIMSRGSVKTLIDCTSPSSWEPPVDILGCKMMALVAFRLKIKFSGAGKDDAFYGNEEELEEWWEKTQRECDLPETTAERLTHVQHFLSCLLREEGYTKDDVRRMCHVACHKMVRTYYSLDQVPPVEKTCECCVQVAPWYAMNDRAYYTMESCRCTRPRKIFKPLCYSYYPQIPMFCGENTATFVREFKNQPTCSHASLAYTPTAPPDLEYSSSPSPPPSYEPANKRQRSGLDDGHSIPCLTSGEVTQHAFTPPPELFNMPFYRKWPQKTVMNK